VLDDDQEPAADRDHASIAVPEEGAVLSVPSVINRAGIQRVMPVPLSGEERDGLHRSAHTVRAVLDKLEL
jgi:malate/lactate dehydrogenase